MKFTIDRFEGDWAVIVGEDIVFNLPKLLLPKESKEGDIIDIEIAIDQESTKREKEEIRKIIKGLDEKEGDIFL
jgi:hypothetical protein